MTFNTQFTKSTPSPRWILSVKDLPSSTSPAKYKVTKPNGETFVATIKDRKRQVVDALIDGELFCASTVRIGDAVFRLKTDHGLHADTETTAEGRKFYTLNGKVRRIDGGAI